MSTTSTFAIVGASLAGVRAAETLRAEGYTGRVVLIGDEPHLPYDRPPLSKSILIGTATVESILLRPASFYDDNAIDLLLGSRVQSLDAPAGRLTLADGKELTADRVLLATGGRVRSLALPGVGLEGVHVLRTLDDAIAIHDELRQCASVVVIGAGFIGAEVAASACALGCSVTVLEAGPTALGRVLGSELGEWLTEAHRRRGVKVLTGVTVTGLSGRGRVQSVATLNGEFPADLVVIGVGMEPNAELAADAGIAVGNGILVDEHCVTSNPMVFAAGDVASYPSALLGARVRHEQWQHASDHGAAAARSMLGKPEKYSGVPWFWSDQFELTLQMAGVPAPTDEIVWRGATDGDAFCAFYLRDGRLTAALGVNRPKDVRAAMLMIAAGRTLPRDQFEDPHLDLRKAAFAAGS